MSIKCPSWCDSNLGLLLIRMAVAIIFIWAGISKFMAIDQVIGFFGQIGLPAWIAWFTAIVETVGGIAVLLGVFTRLGALGLVVIMIGAIITTQSGRPFAGMGGWNMDLVLLLINLALMMMGPGKYALRPERKDIPSAPQY